MALACKQDIERGEGGKGQEAKEDTDTPYQGAESRRAEI